MVPELYGDGRDFFVSILKSDLLEMAISTLEVVFKIISRRMSFCSASLILELRVSRKSTFGQSRATFVVVNFLLCQSLRWFTKDALLFRL